MCIDVFCFFCRFVFLWGSYVYGQSASAFVTSTTIQFMTNCNQQTFKEKVAIERKVRSNSNCINLIIKGFINVNEHYNIMNKSIYACATNRPQPGANK